MDNTMNSAVDLSVVVTIVDGGDNLERCLTALANQQGNYALEILVPYDHISREAESLRAKFPSFVFLDLGEIFGGSRPRNPLEMHAFYDTRRSTALKAATGRLVGILEDRGIPAADWAKVMIELHNVSDDSVIGGAVINGENHLRTWAIFFCDFGRYQPPLADNNPEYVTDTNIVYKRDALLSVRDLWESKFHEPAVNWALRRQGHAMRLTDQPLTVQHRQPLGLVGMARERLHWARLYGQVRGREITQIQRFKLCLAMPALPLILFVRHFRCQLSKRRHIGRFVLAALGRCISWHFGP